MNIHAKILVPSMAVLLCFGSFTLCPFPPKDSFARPIASSLLTRAQSITLKLTMPNGTWIRVTEQDGGLITMRRDKRVLTLAPQIVEDNRAVITIRLLANTDQGSRALFEKSIEVGRRSRYPSLRELAQEGLSFDLTVEGIQIGQIARSTLEPSVFPQGPDQPATCCVSCDGVQTCACAVEATCGSCCSGPCCDPESHGTHTF